MTGVVPTSKPTGAMRDFTFAYDPCNCTSGLSSARLGVGSRQVWLRRGMPGELGICEWSQDFPTLPKGREFRTSCCARLFFIVVQGIASNSYAHQTSAVLSETFFLEVV